MSGVSDSQNGPLYLKPESPCVSKPTNQNPRPTGLDEGKKISILLKMERTRESVPPFLDTSGDVWASRVKRFMEKVE